MNLELLLAVAAPAAKVAAQPQTWLDSFKGGNLPFNWFDIAVVVVLAVGFTRGRKHGMSEEMMYLMQWVAMILGAAWAYVPGGDWLSAVCPVSHLASYVVAYIATALIIRVFFLIFRKLVGGKLIGSNIFGAAEYYLGMAAGIARFACIIIFALALVNARFYSDAEIKAALKYNTDLYGSDFFPTLQTVQSEVFKRSFIGPKIKTHLAGLLIKPTPPEKVAVKRPGEYQWQ